MACWGGPGGLDARGDCNGYLGVPLWTMRSIRRDLHFAAERRRKGEPASSMKTIRMFGASAGSRRGATDAYRPTPASFARQCWPRALAGMEGTLASQVCPSGQPFILPWSLCPALPTLERGG
jgi:hypothetical protein